VNDTVGLAARWLIRELGIASFRTFSSGLLGRMEAHRKS
jgi:hypothetical protein